MTGCTLDEFVADSKQITLNKFGMAIGLKSFLLKYKISEGEN
jgi:hypothetical protein